MLEAAILRQEEIQALLPRAIRPTHREASRSRSGCWGARTIGRGAFRGAGARRLVRSSSSRVRRVSARPAYSTSSSRAWSERASAGELLRAGAASSVRPARHRPPFCAAGRRARCGSVAGVGADPPELALRSRSGTRRSTRSRRWSRSSSSMRPGYLSSTTFESADPRRSPRSAICSGAAGTCRQCCSAGSVGATSATNRFACSSRMCVSGSSRSARPPEPWASPTCTSRPAAIPLRGRDGRKRRCTAPSPGLSEALLGQCRAAERTPTACSRRVRARAARRPGNACRFLHVDATELVEELERLCEHRILRVDGFRFRFRYDLVREVLLASIPRAAAPTARTPLRGRAPVPARARHGRAGSVRALSPRAADRNDRDRARRARSQIGTPPAR